MAGCHGNLPVAAGTLDEVQAVGGRSHAGVAGRHWVVGAGSLAVHLRVVSNIHLFDSCPSPIQ